MQPFACSAVLFYTWCWHFALVVTSTLHIYRWVRATTQSYLMCLLSKAVWSYLMCLFVNEYSYNWQAFFFFSFIMSFFYLLNSLGSGLVSTRRIVVHFAEQANYMEIRKSIVFNILSPQFAVYWKNKSFIWEHWPTVCHLNLFFQKHTAWQLTST